ncbi:hypothetical protein CPAV1605_473 [seawater metagenome]|uniref:Uncharacterized protein n=1 Tax=seawater metagenome TaxID=1561972 RepID=A0A5E8CH56_9ZZZZ
MQSEKITKRLSRDSAYSRPKKTYQEKLSPDDIEEKLEEYIKVEDIAKVPLNSHIRYFTYNPKTKKKEFRLGGFLTRKDNPDKYVILSNGNLSWSVQTAETLFFKKMSIKELKTEYEDQIEKLTQENTKLKKYAKKLKAKLNSKEK